MTDDILEFVRTQLAEDEQVARQAAPRNDDGSLYHPVWIYDREHFRVLVEDGSQIRFDGTTDVDGTHAARHDPERVLRNVAFMRRIVELHTTGVYRTYQCSNGDHIQEWQCERANEPYTEHRYCEVCGGSECVEVPLLAEIWAGRPGYKPEWRVS